MRHGGRARRSKGVGYLGRLLFALVLVLPVVVVVAAWAGVPARSQLARSDKALTASSRPSKLANLQVSSAAVGLAAGNLVGSATVENLGTARARSSTAGLAWKSAASDGLIQLGKFTVPASKPGQRHKVHFQIPVPKNTHAGVYTVTVCADVLGQVQESNKKGRCHKAGTITVGGSGVKAFDPTAVPPASGSPPGGSSPSPASPTPTPTTPASSPPGTTINSGPSGAVDGTTAVFAFSSNEAGSTFQCSLDTAPWEACTSPKEYTGLAQGQHAFQVRAINTAGETDPTPAEAAWTVDTIVPVVTLASPANGSATNHNTPTFSGSAGSEPLDSSIVTVKIYSGSTLSGSPVQTLSTTELAGAYSVAASGVLPDGIYTAQASQSDAAGNIGKSSPSTFTTDTVAPKVTLTEPIDGSTTKSKPAFAGAAGTEPGDSTTVSVSVYAGSTATGTPVQTLSAIASGSSWQVTPTTALANGVYTVQATQTDAAGNVGKSTPSTFTVSTPAVTLTAPKAGAETNNTTPTFSGAAGIATSDLPTITVNIYAGSTATGSPVQTLTTTASAGAWSVAATTPLFNGEYTVQATQEDDTGNIGASAAVTFTVNTTPPVVTLTEPAENAVVGQSKPTFAGAAGTAKGDAQSVTLTIYPGTTTTAPTSQVYVVPVSEGGWSVTPTTALADGTYTAQATQTDAAGNTGTSSANTFSVQTKAPGPVTSVAVAGNTGSSISLSWTNPSGPDFAGVVVRRAVGSTAPASPTEGTAVAETTGETHTLTDSTVISGTTYSYALFAHNAQHGYAAAATITVKATESTGGCTDTWGGATNSEWTEASNWSSGHVPGPGDWVCIPSRASNLPVELGETQVIEGLTDQGGLIVNGNLSLTDSSVKSTSTGAIAIGGSLSVANELEVSSLNLAGALDGPGSVTVPSGGSLTLVSGRLESGLLINDGTGTVVANTQASLGTGAKLVNGGSLSFAVGSSLNGGCEKTATDTEPAVPAGEFDSTGSITTSGTSSTGSSPVTIGPSNNCLVTNETGSLNVASGELKLGGSNFNFDSGSTVKGATSSQLALEGTVSFNASSTSLAVPVVVTGSTTGSGNVTATASLKLDGSLGGSGSVTVPSGASLTLDSGQIDSGKLVNEGSGSVTADDQPYVGQAAKLVNSGSLSFAVGSALYGGCGREATATEPAIPNGEFDNTGSVTTNGTSSTGSSPVAIGYPDNYCLVTHDAGSLDVTSGELKLGGSDFNFDTSATVEGASSSRLVLESTVSFNAPTTSLPLPVVVTGRTAGTGNIVAPSSLNLSGTLAGSGSVTVPSGASLTLDSGSIESGELINEGSALVPANDTPDVEQGAKLLNKGSLSFAVGSSLYGGCGREATATEPAIPSGEFDNSGSVTTNGTSSTGSSPVTIGYPYNYCLVTQDEGSLDVASGELRLGGSDFNFDTGSTVTGASSSKLVLEGTVSFNAASTSLPVPVVVPGRTAGAGNVVASSLALSGTLDGSGSVTVPSGGSLTLDSGSIESGELINEGSASVPANHVPYVERNAKLVNKGSLSFAVGSALYGGCGHEATATEPAIPNGEFDNTGSITTNGTSGTGSSPITIGYPYNYCLITHDSGSLNLASGELKLGGSDFNFDPGATVTGATSSQLTLEGTVSFNAPHTALPVPVVVTGSTAGAGNVVTSSSLKLTGSLGGSGSVTIPSGGSLVLEGGQIESGKLVNEGAGSVTASDQPYVGRSAELVNSGSLSFAVGSALRGGCGREATATEPAIPNGEFDNTGSITTNGTSSTGSSPVQIGTPYYNYCLVTQDSGSLDVASGELKLGGSDFNFDTGSTVTGAASSQLVLEGTVSFNASSTSLPVPVVVTGTTNGAGNVVASSSLKLAGALEGSGTVEVPSGGTLVLESGEVNTGELVNDGSGSVTADAQPYVGEGAKLVNGGSLSFAVGSTLRGGCGREATATEPAILNGEFDNTGSVTTNGMSSTGSSAVQIGAPYYNYCLVAQDSGSLDVASGELKLGGSDFNFDTGSTVTGAGSSKLVLEGTVSFNASSTTLGVPVVVTGETNGGGNVLAPSSLKLAGELDGSGSTTVPSGGSLVLEGGQVDSGELVNEGGGSVTADAQPDVGQGAKLVNHGSLSFAVGSSLDGGCGQEATATQPAIPNGEFDNTGSVTTNGTSNTGSSPVQIGAPYYNYCLVTQDSGSLDVASGELRLGGSDFNFNTGSTVTGASSSKLALEGTVTSMLSSVGGVGSVAIAGLLHTEHSLSLPATKLDGQLEISSGDVVAASSLTEADGSLELDGNGNFGRLVVGGSVALANMSLSFTSLEYVPGCGATITALTAGSVVGGFNSVSGGDSLAEGSWEPWSSATAAGGYRYCPPPPTPEAQTYGEGSSWDSYNPSGYEAEPVNTATGAYNTTETDASMPGLGAPFTFTRSYTSSNKYSGPLGSGWTDSLNVFLTLESDGDVVLSSENGQQTTFVPQGEGVYTSGPGTRSTLTSQSGGGWLLVRQDQERLTFNESGQMVTETDRNGIGLTLSYNESDQLTSVKDYAGRVVTLSYDSAGLLASMSLPLGRTVSYGYNSSNQLASVTDAAGGVTSYEYNGEGLLASITNQDDHQVVANTYSEGKVVKQVNALGGVGTFSYENETTTYTDPGGNSWKDVYSGDVLVERIDPIGGVTRYAYDANLDKTAVTDANEHTTTMSYDASGNMLAETSPLGETKSWTYDGLSDVTSYIDADGNKTSYSYDEKGNLLGTKYADGTATGETHDPMTGAVTSITNALGNTTHYGYDTKGNLTSMTSPLGEKTTYGYDAAGRKTSIVSPRGNEQGSEPAKYTTLYAYEPNNRLVSVTDPDGDVTKTTYDKVGNRTSVTNPDGDTTKWAYDAQNELTSVTDPEGGITKYTYDTAGNRESATTPLGHTTDYSYDADGRLKMMTNPLRHSATYTYDSAGNRSSVTDANGAKTKYVYNADDELTETSYSDGTPTVSYTYDAAGNRTQMIDGTGTTMYTYDARNRVTAVSGPQGNFSYSYDKDGDIKTRTDPDGATITETYDDDGRLASITADGQTTSYTYDADSQLTKTTLPAGNGYTETTTYDPAGRVASISDSNGKGTLSSFAYTYDAAGNPTKIATNTTTITYGYDKDERLTSACYGIACGEGSIEDTYDTDGDRKKLVDSAGTTSYSYNEGDQLTTLEGPGGKTSYSYDNDGQRTAADTTTYAWNAANELTKLTSSGVPTTYAYDGTGNRVSATSGGQTVASHSPGEFVRG